MSYFQIKSDMEQHYSSQLCLGVQPRLPWILTLGRIDYPAGSPGTRKDSP